MFGPTHRFRSCAVKTVDLVKDLQIGIPDPISHFIESLKEVFGHPAQRRHALTYLAAALDPESYGTPSEIEQGAGGGCSDYQAIQHFLADSRWDPSRLLQLVRGAALPLTRPTYVAVISGQLWPHGSCTWSGDLFVAVGDGRAAVVAAAMHRDSDRWPEDLVEELIRLGLPLISDMPMSDVTRDRLHEHGLAYLSPLPGSAWVEFSSGRSVYCFDVLRELSRRSVTPGRIIPAPVRLAMPGSPLLLRERPERLLVTNSQYHGETDVAATNDGDRMKLLGRTFEEALDRADTAAQWLYDNGLGRYRGRTALGQHRHLALFATAHLLAEGFARNPESRAAMSDWLRTQIHRRRRARAAATPLFMRRTEQEAPTDSSSSARAGRA